MHELNNIQTNRFPVLSISLVGSVCGSDALFQHGVRSAEPAACAGERAARRASSGAESRCLAMQKAHRTTLQTRHFAAGVCFHESHGFIFTLRAPASRASESPLGKNRAVRDGWWVDGWLDGWMDGWMNGWMGWMGWNGMDGRLAGEWMGWMDG